MGDLPLRSRHGGCDGLSHPGLAIAGFSGEDRGCGGLSALCLGAALDVVQRDGAAGTSALNKGGSHS